MKKETYYILVDNATLLNPGKVSFKSITGEPIKIKGYERYDFFIHRSGDISGYKWVISEGQTGLKLNMGETRKETIRRVLNVLNKMSKKNLDKTIKYYISEYGLSPKYR